uniref:Uncharacterized protein n=1 Tax=Rhizophagus irregularis (strain DAOM 181602 / DAOM 197198 / MUCL 43194) TaxID=747089 RepID=U9UWY8_RHIID
MQAKEVLAMFLGNKYLFFSQKKPLLTQFPYGNLTTLQENTRIVIINTSLRTIYRMLTGDVPTANTTNDAKVNERVKNLGIQKLPLIYVSMEEVDPANMTSFRKFKNLPSRLK